MDSSRCFRTPGVKNLRWTGGACAVAVSFESKGPTKSPDLSATCVSVPFVTWWAVVSFRFRKALPWNDRLSAVRVRGTPTPRVV